MTEINSTGNLKKDFGRLANNELSNQSEIDKLSEQNKSLRLELQALRFKESQEQRFIWWIWNVYARNVQELLLELEKTTFPVTPFGMSALVKHIKEGTNGIYDGTYLDVEISTVVKTSSDNNKCWWTQESDPEVFPNLWRAGCGNSFWLDAEKPSDNHMKYCCYCGKEIAEGE